MILVLYIGFALGLSLSCLSATFITDIVCTILLSTIVLRLLESLSISLSKLNLNMLFCMEVTLIALLIPSILLEIISIGFRSFSLGFRIFANVAAGHVLSDILLVSRYLGYNSSITILWGFLFSLVILIYEFLVACIQIGVFISLTSVYAE